jgi:hypothetical protein
LAKPRPRRSDGFEELHEHGRGCLARLYKAFSIHLVQGDRDLRCIKRKAGHHSLGCLGPMLGLLFDVAYVAIKQNKKVFLRGFFVWRIALSTRQACKAYVERSAPI